jgi:hypothetical protein
VFDPSSTSRLTDHDLGRFPDDTLFHRIARVVCGTGCLPRKELFESWEVARRVRRRFRGGRVVDLCAGHGLLGQIMLLLDDSSPSVLIVDRSLPPSSSVLQEAMVRAWPRLESRCTFRAASIDDVMLDVDDVVVSIHACGGLTDRVIARASAAGARLAVMPCCHDLDVADTGGLAGWMNGPLAVDVMRATRLRARGWHVWMQTIPAEITPCNRLLMGTSDACSGSGGSGASRRTTRVGSDSTPAADRPETA